MTRYRVTIVIEFETDDGEDPEERAIIEAYDHLTVNDIVEVERIVPNQD